MKNYLIASVAFMSVAGCSQAANEVSGVYLAQAPNELVFIQLVKAADGNVTGRGEIITAKNGSISTQPFSLTGTADGTQISLKSNMFLGLGPSFSGQIKGNTLTLLGADGQTVLKRASLDEFGKQKAQLATSDQNAEVANQKAKTDADQKRVVSLLNEAGTKIEASLPDAHSRLSGRADEILSKTKSAHDVITGDIAKLKAKWKITPSDDKMSVEGDIMGREGDIMSLKGDYTAALTNLRASYDEIESGLVSFKANCESAASKGYAPLPVQCGNAQSYLDQHEAARGAVKTRIDAASVAMFPR